MRALIAGSLSFLAIAAPAAAEAPELTEPAALVAQFNDTCRRGFPDLGTIKAHAVRNGWVERGVRSLQPGNGAASEELPQFLQKDGFTLVLSTTRSFGGIHSCQLSRLAAKTVDTSALAAAAGAAFSNGAFKVTKVKGEEFARLRVNSQLLVQATVSRRKPRSATLLVRVEP